MTKMLNVTIAAKLITTTWADRKELMTLSDNVTAEEILSAVEESIETILKGETLDEIVIENKFDGLVVLDEAAHSLSSVLVADDNDTHFIEALTMNGIGGQLERKNGHVLHTGMPVIQILRLKNNQAEVYAKAVSYSPLTTFLRAALTGKNVMTVEEAKETGLFDQELNKWDTQGLALTGLETVQLPEIGVEKASELTNQQLLAKMSVTPVVKVH